MYMTRMRHSWHAIGIASTLYLLVIYNGYDSPRKMYPDVLYTAPHAEMAPFQRVWNPDTRSYFSVPDFSKESDEADDKGEKNLCGVDGSKCPELPAFNGEDYFDSKPIGLKSQLAWKIPVLCAVYSDHEINS